MTHQDAFAGLSLEGHRVLVVGAGAGIGAAGAQLLSRRGAEVICADRHGKDVEALASSIGGRAVHLDVTDEAEVRDVIEGVLAEGALHALVNCAGITGQTGVRSESIPVANFDQVWDINTRGAFLLAQAVLPRMVEQGYGRILHIASIAGKEGNAGMVSYSASKAGLIGMVKAMGKEYAQTGVTINSLAPAVIRTAMVEQMPDEQVAYMTEKIPMNRCGTLEEVAEAICWAVAPAASFTTGFAYDLSGGRAVY